MTRATGRGEASFLSQRVFVVLLLLGVSFALRFCFMQFRAVIDIDGVYYAMLGKNLFAGKGYVEPEGIYQWYYPPFFPVNIGLVGLVVRDIERAAEWVSLLYGAILPLTVLYVAHLTHGFETGVIAGFLTALFVPLIEFSSSATAESMFTFYTVLLACSGYMLIVRKKPALCLALGLLTGVLYLVKPAGVQYLGVSLLLIAIGAWYRKWGKKAIAAGVALFALGWGVLSVPYLVYLRNHYGYWTLSELSTRNLIRSVLVTKNDNKEKEYQLAKDGKEMLYIESPSGPAKHLGLWEVVKDDHTGFLHTYFRNLAVQVKRTFTYGHTRSTSLLFLALVAFGFLRTLRGTRGTLNALFLGAMLLPFLTYPLISTEAKRWILPFAAILSIWQGHGIYESQRAVASSKAPFCRHGRWSRLIRNYGLYVLALLVVGYETSTLLFHSLMSQNHYYPTEHKEMGLLMKQVGVPEDALIMSISPQTSFYAQTRVKTLPWAEYPEIIRYARHHRVDYIVIDESFIPTRRPQLAFLLDEKAAPPELKLAYKLVGKNGRKILTYRLTEAL